jgi:hypothetical protein
LAIKTCVALFELDLVQSLYATQRSVLPASVTPLVSFELATHPLVARVQLRVPLKQGTTLKICRVSTPKKALQVVYFKIPAYKVLAVL